MRKTANDAKIARELDSLEALLIALPDNPIGWVSIVKLIAPIVARLAVRYALKRVKRSLSEEKVNLIGKGVADWVGAMIEKRTGS